MTVNQILAFLSVLFAFIGAWLSLLGDAAGWGFAVIAIFTMVLANWKV